MRWGNRGKRQGFIRPGAQGNLLGLAAVALGLVTVACGSGDGTSEASDTVQQGTTEDTALPPCGDSAGQVVVFGIQGVLTGNDEIEGWLEGDTDAIPVAEGAPELATAYHDLGYGIIYQTVLPQDFEMEGRPWTEILGQWLQTHGFPYEGPAQLITVQDREQAAVALVNLLTDDQTATTAYVQNDLFIEGLVAGGIPRQQIYTMTGDAEAMGTIAMTREEFPDHATEIAAQPAICQR